MRINTPDTSRGKQIVRSLMTAAILTMAANPANGQDISQIGKSDPLIITGSIGTQNTYYHSSMGTGYMSPLSNSVYANLNVSIYGFSMPFSLYFSNNNLDFSYPQISFNLTPRYKNFIGHLGQSSIPFSNYILNMSFNGIGLEYRGKHFRTSAFYGVLRRAINDDPTDPTPRNPQYKRYGWGFSAGYGNDRHSVDIYLLRAYDSPGSIDEAWREKIRPQENLLVGIKGRVTPFRWMSLSVNAATSAFTADRESPKVTSGEATRWDKIFDAKYTSSLRFAGDASLGLNFRGFSANIFYKIIQPDYTSLGTYYTSNNYHSLGISLGTMLFNKVSLAANFSGQSDNLNNKQLYTTNGYVYSASAGMNIGQNFNITAMYNGYLQNQTDGSMAVNDTTRVNRILHSASIMPSYNIMGNLLDHSISLSANYTQNKDLNKFSIGQSDVKTLALGGSYSMTVKPWATTFGFNLSHQQTNGFNMKYLSDVASFSTGRSFLKDNNLSLGMTLSAIYNEVEHQSKSLSLAFDMSASYTLAKAHVFSFSAQFSKYGDVNIDKTRSSLDATDIRLSLNYVYTFSLLEIKNKQKEGAKK